MGTKNDPGGRSVVAVPDFTTYQLMRPYEDFTDDYQGQSVTARPIMLSPDGIPRDENAANGVSGYDPNLVRGHPVKVGQRVVVIFPNLTTDTLPAHSYIYQIIWRLRTVFDFRNNPVVRMPYSLQKQSQGVADVGGANPGPRVIVPAIWNSIVFEQLEPATDGVHVVNHVRGEDLTAHSTVQGTPFVPGGANGAIQQGILSSAVSGYTQPWFLINELQAIGDEILIALYRTTDAGATWDFAGADANLATYLSEDTPDLGVYVSRGVAP